MNEISDRLEQLYAETHLLPEPENLYEGLRLPEDFELPDNILLFYHDFCAPSPNAHYRYTLVFPFAGMRYYVDQLQYDLLPGQMLLLHPYQLRFLSPKSADYRRFFITFTLRKPQPYLPRSGVCTLNGESYTLLEQLLSAFRDGAPRRLAVELFRFLDSLAEKMTAGESRKMSPQIAGAIRFINENLNRQISNQDIADELNMSESNLRRRFRAEIGQSLKNYIDKQRLELAKYYLRETLMRIDEIAALCGFASVFAFSHFFKHQTGIPPLRFRLLRNARPRQRISS